MTSSTVGNGKTGYNQQSQMIKGYLRAQPEDLKAVPPVFRTYTENSLIAQP